MQEINLLQNKLKDRTLQWENRNRLIIIIFGFVVLFEIMLTGGLLYLTKNSKDEYQTVSAKNDSIQQAIDSNQTDLAQARGLQAQLKNLKNLVAHHVYWSQFFDTLSHLTIVKSQFTGFTGSVSDNKIQITGIAPSYTDVAKLLLSINTANQFSDIKLQSLAPSDGKVFGYNFVIEAKANSNLFTK